MAELTDEQFTEVLTDVFNRPEFLVVKNQIMEKMLGKDVVDRVMRRALVAMCKDPEIRKLVQERANVYQQARRFNEIPVKKIGK